MPKINLQNGQIAQRRVEAITSQVKPPGRRLSNWLMSYGKYTERNEAPSKFHLWVGLGTIASALRRRVQITTPYFEVHSNIYVVLVAPPGTARKTTALKIGRKLLKEVPGIHFTTSASSTAALIQQFSALPEKEHQSLTAYSYELGSMLPQGNIEMIDFITDIYDCNPDWDKQTIARSHEKIPRPWLTILGATTPRWLGDNLSSTAVEGGLIARILFIYHDERNLKESMPKEDPALQALRSDLINDLTHISTLNGEVTLAPDAFEYYDAWYHDESRFPKIIDDRTSGYYDRKHIHCLKVAMLLSASECDDLVIRLQDIKLALSLLEGIEPDMNKSFRSVGKNPYATDLERIKLQIESAPEGMPFDRLIRANYHAVDRRTLDEIIQQLMGMKAIKLGVGNVYHASKHIG